MASIKSEKSRGKTTQIYFPDGNVLGLKSCDFKNSIVKLFYVPRFLLKESSEFEELHFPGVYFLFGDPIEKGKPELYIGETEDLIDRLYQHNLDEKKDFWTIAICMVSIKNNLDKAHIGFLEHYFHKKAGIANKVILQNLKNPTSNKLTRQETDFALEFYDEAKQLFAILGQPIFEETKTDENSQLTCKANDITASGTFSEVGLTVLKGSHAALIESPSAEKDKWVVGMRNKLRDLGILKQTGSSYIFTENYEFASPSSAATVVLGRRANGWNEWKYSDGKTLDEKYRKTK